MSVAQVVIRRGDLFDGAKDVIVIPCNTMGGVTDFVIEKLLHHNLIFDPRPLELGGVRFQQLETAIHVAQYAAFAASVDRNTSIATPDALTQIGESLGQFATENAAARFFSAPLLGTGYGGLRPELSVESLKLGFMKTAPDNSTLCLNSIDPTAYDMVLRAFRPQPTKQMATRPHRVFISYTRSSDEHANWVKELATQLRGSGIEARLDVWHLRPGMDLPQWMCTELSLADKVIIVTDQAYAERADGRVGGVGWETMVIQGDMGKLPPDSTKYLVIVRTSEFDHGLPLYLKTKFAIHSPPERGVNSLVPELVAAISESYDVPDVTESAMTI